MPWSILVEHCFRTFSIYRIYCEPFHPPTTRLFGVYPFLAQLTALFSEWENEFLENLKSNRCFIFSETTHLRHKLCVRSLGQILLPTYVPVKFNWIEWRGEEEEWFRGCGEQKRESNPYCMNTHPPTHDWRITIAIYMHKFHKLIPFRRFEFLFNFHEKNGWTATRVSNTLATDHFTVRFPVLCLYYSSSVLHMRWIYGRAFRIRRYWDMLHTENNSDGRDGAGWRVSGWI